MLIAEACNKEILDLDYGSSAILVMPGVAVTVAGSMDSILIYFNLWSCVTSYGQGFKNLVAKDHLR